MTSVVVPLEQWNKIRASLHACRSFVEHRSHEPSKRNSLANEARLLFAEQHKIDGLGESSQEEIPLQEGLPLPVHSKDSTVASTTPDLPRLYQASHTFTAGSKHQLSFSEGAMIVVVARPSAQWWVGRDSQGRQGWVPYNFLQPEGRPCVNCVLSSRAMPSSKLFIDTATSPDASRVLIDESYQTQDQKDLEESHKVGYEEGYEKGHKEGYEEGHQEDYEEGCEATHKEGEVKEIQNEGLGAESHAEGFNLEELPLMLAEAEMRLQDVLSERACLVSLLPPTSTFVAKYDFFAVVPGQLSFHKGEVLRVLQCDPGGWWLAESQQGSKGMIPYDSLRLPDYEPTKADHPFSQCMEALYDFEASSTNQLSFVAGDVLEVGIANAGGWSLARDLKGQQGVVPRGFLKPGLCSACSSMETRGAQELPGKESLTFAREVEEAGSGKDDLRYFYQALYDFQAVKNQQLSFKQGDELYIVRRGDVGWCLARDTSGREGLIPWNYVQLSCQGALLANEFEEGCLDLLLPSGCISKLNGSVLYPDGSQRDEHGVIHFPDGTRGIADNDALPDGCLLLGTGYFRYPSGAESTFDGRLKLGNVNSEPIWQLPSRARGLR